MFRCANDIFGYCTGQPDSLETPGMYYYTEVTGKKIAYTGMARSCLKDNHTCGQFKTFTESLPAQLQEALK